MGIIGARAPFKYQNPSPSLRMVLGYSTVGAGGQLPFVSSLRNACCAGLCLDLLLGADCGVNLAAFSAGSLCALGNSHSLDHCAISNLPENVRAIRLQI